jgi:hypothetical protein
MYGIAGFLWGAVLGERSAVWSFANLRLDDLTYGSSLDRKTRCTVLGKFPVNYWTSYNNSPLYRIGKLL